MSKDTGVDDNYNSQGNSGEEGIFRFTLPIMRTLEPDAANPHIVYLDAYASDCSRDGHDTEMSPETIFGFVDCVNGGSPVPVTRDAPKGAKSSPLVGVDNEHSEQWQDQIGWAAGAQALNEVPAELKDTGAVAPIFRVKLAIDTNYSHGRDLVYALKSGRRLGVSIAGSAEPNQTEQRIDPATGRMYRRFGKIVLRKIAITKQPSNKNVWLRHIERSLLNGDTSVQEEEIKRADGTATEPAPVVEAEVPAVETVDAPAMQTSDNPATAEGQDATAEATDAPAATSDTPATPELAPAETPAPAESATPDESVASASTAAESAPAEPTVETPAAPAGEEVARTLVAGVEEQVTVLRTTITEQGGTIDVLRTLLAQVGPVLQEQAESIAVLRTELDARTVQGKEQAEVIRTLGAELGALREATKELAVLRAEVKRLGDEPMGRKGHVARVLPELENADKMKETRKALRDAGREDLAAALMVL